MITLLFSLFGTAYGHGPDANIFDELDAFWPTPNAVRTATGVPGQEYWQQEADYTIHVTLDPDEKRILGRESIVYTNNSPDTLHYVWMQLDPNYLSKLSARGRMQTAPHMATENASLDVGYVRALEVREDYEPNLEIANVKVNGAACTPIIRDTQMRLSLETPLEPSAQLTIDLEWSYTMNDASVLWARSGYEILEDDAIIFEVAQFYPRMNIYTDLEGWLTKPYLGTGEFATEFGDYDVYITVPEDHIVGSTGELQNPEDVLNAAQRARLKKSATSEEPVFIVKPVEAEQNRINTTKKTKTWHFTAENVRDFAWGSSNAFVWDAWGREIDGKTVMAMSYYPKEGMPMWIVFPHTPLRTPSSFIQRWSSPTPILSPSR